MTRPLQKVCLLIIVFFLATCGSVPQATPEPAATPSPTATAKPTATPEWMGGYERQTIRFVGSEDQRAAPPETSSADVPELVEGNNAFALDLYQTLSENEGNLFFSPYSISLALAMAYAGARGETEQQMADVLHYGLPQERLHPAFNDLDQTLARRSEEVRLLPDQRYELAVANAVWGQDNPEYPILPEYLDLLALNYGAGLRLLDFFHAPDACRLTINEWVSNQTRGRIPDLLPRGSIHPLTRMILTNAIYFNASWDTSFDPDETKNKTFYLLDGGQVPLPMMKGDFGSNYLLGDGFQSVELLYVGGRTRMLIVMPDEGQFESFEPTLDTGRLDALLGEMAYGKITLTMPTFEFDSQLPLGRTLSSMGMPLAFSLGEADFSGIVGQPWLYVDDVLHKAWVSVDEKGTEAAAAMGTLLVAPSLDPHPPPKPVEITIDHPFIVFIQDLETGAILFMGRVLDPRL